MPLRVRAEERGKNHLKATTRAPDRELSGSATRFPRVRLLRVIPDSAPAPRLAPSLWYRMKIEAGLAVTAILCAVPVRERRPIGLELLTVRTNRLWAVREEVVHQFVRDPFRDGQTDRLANSCRGVKE